VRIRRGLRLKVQPENAGARRALGIVCAQTRDRAGLLTQVEELRALNPDFAEKLEGLLANVTANSEPRVN
jgi:hypothetical protein